MLTQLSSHKRPAEWNRWNWGSFGFYWVRQKQAVGWRRRWLWRTLVVFLSEDWDSIQASNGLAVRLTCPPCGSGLLKWKKVGRFVTYRAKLKVIWADWRGSGEPRVGGECSGGSSFSPRWAACVVAPVIRSVHNNVNLYNTPPTLKDRSTGKNSLRDVSLAAFLWHYLLIWLLLSISLYHSGSTEHHFHSFNDFFF